MVNFSFVYKKKKKKKITKINLFFKHTRQAVLVKALKMTRLDKMRESCASILNLTAAC